MTGHASRWYLTYVWTNQVHTSLTNTSPNPTPKTIYYGLREETQDLNAGSPSGSE